jgi:type IV secretion system protein VirB10
MAKDPFQELPTLEPEGEPVHQHFSEPAQENATEVAASAPPRNLLKSLTKWLVPAFVLGIFAWVFFSPDTPRGAKRVEQQKVDVDTKMQTVASESMYKQFQADADKPKLAVVVPVMPGSRPLPPPTQSAQAASQLASSPLPPGLPASPRTGYTPASSAATSSTYAPATAPSYATTPATGYAAQGYQAGVQAPSAMTEEAMKRIADMQKRQEDIRAAPLEAGQVHLLSQSNAAAAPTTPAVVADLQANIASERAASLQSQQGLQEKMLAAMTPKEPAKSRGNNEEFMAGAAGTANTAPQVTTLQAAAGRYLVGEGTVIRSVLLTNVNSDLPGRILARITSDVYDTAQRRVVIPKGSLINGIYNSQVIVGQERLLMAMTRLTLPNGNWISLNGSGATDMMGTSGVDAEVNNHFMKMFSSSLVIGATTLMLPRADTTVTALPGTTGTSGAATAGSVFATTLQDVVSKLLDRNKNIAPTLSLKAGQEFLFMANQDMLMTPYQ